MIEAQEYEVAIDELRWLISGCSDFMAAHNVLGELAVLAHNDLPLARGHFGFAYELGKRVLHRAGNPHPLPFRQPANQPFFLAGQGLAWCLQRLDKRPMAAEIAELLHHLDPQNPLRVAAMLDDLQTGGLPLVDLLGPERDEA